jgi:hypothetical protein
MAYFSGRDGTLYVGTVKVAQVGSWSLNSNVDMLDTTTLSNFGRKYIPGLKSSTGSASIFYYDDAPRILLEKVMKVGAIEQTDVVRLTLGWGVKKIEIDAWINQADLACQTGEVMRANITFTVQQFVSTAL